MSSTIQSVLTADGLPLPWRPIAPGEVIRQDILVPYGLTQDQLAAKLGVQRRTVNELVKGRRAVSTEMAIRLWKLTGQAPEFWLGLQMRRDLYRFAEDGGSVDVAPLEPLAKSADGAN